MDNPLQQFFLDRIDYFTEEAKRLKDQQPLVEYKNLIDTFHFIGKKLGTVEHEIALAKMASEFKLASSESADTRRTIWRDFKIARARAILTENSMTESYRKAVAVLSELEESYAALPEDNEVRASMRSVLDAMQHTTSAERNLGKGWRKSAWLILYVNLCAYTVYIRYAIAKAMFFVFRHGFIFLTSILIFGIAFSKLSKIGVESIASYFPQWPWVFGVLTVAVYLFKKYIIDPRLRKLQVNLEAKWLRRLIFHLHAVRAMAHVSRTSRRSSPSEAQIDTPSTTPPNEHKKLA